MSKSTKELLMVKSMSSMEKQMKFQASRLVTLSFKFKNNLMKPSNVKELIFS